jgi:phosphoenolpyruvate-protein phosphotransferase
VAPAEILVTAPLEGWSTALSEVPDAVFAGRMLGDGVAIDPIDGVLYAPCDGTLIVVAATKHAVTIRAANGAEILLHVGIDTVGLAGAGFTQHVVEGQRVRAGDRLIDFDLELLAQRAKSLLTPIILTNAEQFEIVRRAVGAAVRPGDFLFEIRSLGVPAVAGEPSGGKAVQREVVVALEHGIHARPAAALASAVKSLAVEITVAVEERQANAKSPVAMMSLGVRKGDRVRIRATGPDAEQAASALERLLSNSGHTTGSEQASIVADHGRPVAFASAPMPTTDAIAGAQKSFAAVIASRGLAIGSAVVYLRAHIEVAESGQGAAHERAQLERARESVRQDLLRTLGASGSAGPQAAREVAAAHLELIDDPELLADAGSLMQSGKSAGFAWRAVLRKAAGILRALSDQRMAERAEDLLDLESRVLTALTGEAGNAPVLPADAILIAKDLLPSQLSGLDPAKLVGICLAAGGPTSHVAIIAAAMDVPTLVAAGSGVLEVAAGTALVLDAEEGRLLIDPTPAQLQSARARLAQGRARRGAEQIAAGKPGATADGVRVEVLANVGSLADARLAVRNGAEGCGLLRTEFLFLERQSPPDESEQLEIYQQIARELKGRPLTIRTLDIGGDKPIPYLPLPREDNPALGLRGVRTSLWRPDLLRVQLRAILRVQPVGQCRVMLPMITEPGEIRTVRLLLDELRSESGYRAPIPLGVMIETPAAAIMADRIAREADFLSVGTNDLTQYTLAMDRGHPELAARLDGLHPAVLRLIARVTEAAGKQDRPVAVCGGLASDPVAVPILIGLGVHELSMVPAAIPALKALIATITLDECTALVVRALESESAEAVRALTLQRVPGLGVIGRARE